MRKWCAYLHLGVGQVQEGQVPQAAQREEAGAVDAGADGDYQAVQPRGAGGQLSDGPVWQAPAVGAVQALQGGAVQVQGVQHAAAPAPQGCR